MVQRPMGNHPVLLCGCRDRRWALGLPQDLDLLAYGRGAPQFAPVATSGRSVVPPARRLVWIGIRAGRGPAGGLHNSYQATGPTSSHSSAILPAVKRLITMAVRVAGFPVGAFVPRTVKREATLSPSANRSSTVI